MPQPFDENSTFPFDCPRCGNKIEETIRRLEQNPKLTCSQCGAIINVKADKLREGFNRAEDMLRDAGFSKK